MRKLFNTFALILCFSASSLFWPLFNPTVHASSVTIRQEQTREAKRVIYMDLDAIFNLLDIRFGMSILKLGADSGDISGALSAKMNDTGEIIVADHYSPSVIALNNRVFERKISNVKAILINEENVDNLLLLKKYDLILMFNNYLSFENVDHLLTSLLPTLKRRGQLGIITYSVAPLVSEDEILDLRGFTGKLFLNRSTNPFYRGLNSEIQLLLREKKPHLFTEQEKKHLLTGINVILTNPRFFEHFLTGDMSFSRTLGLSPAEKNFASWLILSLRTSGALDTQYPVMTAHQQAEVRQLNRIFFSAFFREYLYQQGEEPFMPGPDAFFQTSPAAIAREVEKRGYELFGRYELPPYYVLLTFRVPAHKRPAPETVQPPVPRPREFPRDLPERTDRQ